MQKQTLKQKLITGLYNAVADNEKFEGKQLFVLTSKGLIQGELVNVKLENEDDSFINDINKISAKYAKNNKSDTIADSDCYIILKDACLVNDSPEFIFKSIIIFFNQIIGISIGNIKDDEEIIEPISSYGNVNYDDLFEDDVFCN